VVSREGVSLYCSRIKTQKFIPFDFIYDLPAHCIFRLKSRGRVFNIPYGETGNAAPPDLASHGAQRDCAVPKNTNNSLHPFIVNNGRANRPKDSAESDKGAALVGTSEGIEKKNDSQSSGNVAFEKAEGKAPIAEESEIDRIFWSTVMGNN
jgi:hypothetical protein